MLIFFVASCILCLILYQLVLHSKWWHGLYVSAIQSIFHKFGKYDQEIHIADDNEKYVIWWPQVKKSSNNNNNNNGKNDHLWICVPGAMKLLSECMELLDKENCFKNSDWCVFNQPGISDIDVVNKPTPPPTDPTYLFDFILKLKNKKEINDNNTNMGNKQHTRYYKNISVIGFSMGGTGSLFLVDKLKDYESKSLVNQIISVHSPELIRETFEHLSSNWLFRFDILCALHVYKINQASKSWQLIDTKMKNVHWLRGWPFMKQISEVIIDAKWDELELRWYNPRRLLKDKVTCVDVIRIISQNDPIVPIDSIDKTLFENYYKIEIHQNGGHCACTKELVQSIERYNQRMIDI